jgi:arylsulfatase A-like enzyme
LPLVGATVAVGVAAGFLELAVLMTQLHGLHRIGLSTLRMSRHVTWMVPVAETLVTAGLALVLVFPVVAGGAWWRRRRARSGAPAGDPRRPWIWAGTILGTLLVLGPLLAIRGLHAGPALVLALGFGLKFRRWVVRPTPRWPRAACWAGAIAAGILPGYILRDWNRLGGAEARAWSRPAPEAPAPNLLWIVMDTVRADRLSVQGYSRPTTPALEQWARRGITFDMARSAAPWTLPSHLTMFTGLWPFEHGARIDRSYHGPAPTLAEHLAAHGYATGGFVGNTGMCNAYYGLGRGFDRYVDNPLNHEVSLRATLLNSALGAWALKLARMAGLPAPAEFPFKARIPAPEVIARAQTWLDGVQHRNAAAASSSGPGSDRPSRRPYFLFLNFVDAHGPYLPLPTAPRAFSTGPLPPRGRAVPQNGWVAVEARNAAGPERRPRLQEELDAVIRRLGDLYDDCLRGLDAELDRFLRQLQAAGLLENTWVVITADHGEHFGEHDLFGHGGSLYNELTHVPLILIPPLAGTRPARGEAGRVDPSEALRGGRVGVPVSHRDLPATMTALLLPGAANPFSGRSLARHWRTDGSGPQPPDPILSQLEEQPLEGVDVQSDRVITMDSVLEDDHVLIETNNSGTELYDLFGDPRQQRNLAGRPAERRRQERLERTLERILRDPDPR